MANRDLSSVPSKESLNLFSSTYKFKCIGWLRLTDNKEKVSLIQMIFSVIISREEKHYVALAPDVDIASQGETIEEALANLKEALELYFEDDDATRPPLTEKPIVTQIEIL